MSRVSLQRESARHHALSIASQSYQSYQSVWLFFVLTIIASASFPTLFANPLYAGEPNSEQVQLYYFTSKGCAPCLLVKPAIESLASDGYPVTTIDVGDRPDWAESFRVTVTPTVALVRGNQIVGQHAGIVKLETLKAWFNAIGYRNVASVPGRVRDRVVENRPEQQKVVLASATSANESFSTPTMLRGTRQPRSQAEVRAMAATVRLSVEDPEGTSFATGTVIHTHDGESLVMTCGHVFRDSQGRGKISVEFGFDNGSKRVVPGELISYDSDARDIALVIIQNGKSPMTAVPVAMRSKNVSRGDMVFSLGCDHGELPTIRHTKIKNRATYDGAIKYDIFGRPVDGRSGGGLFNNAGELVGVCNAAAVEVDEGIYTALDTVHWQLAEVNLSHLFDSRSIPAMRVSQPVSTADAPAARVAAIANQPKMPAAEIARTDNRPRPSDVWRDLNPRKGAAVQPASLSSASNDLASNRVLPATNSRNTANGLNASNVGSQIRNVGFQQEVHGNDKEVIIHVRSKTDLSDNKTITISQPTTKLLRYLDKMSDTGSSERRLDVARYREIKRPASFKR